MKTAADGGRNAFDKRPNDDGIKKCQKIKCRIRDEIRFVVGEVAFCIERETSIAGEMPVNYFKCQKTRLVGKLRLLKLEPFLYGRAPFQFFLER